MSTSDVEIYWFLTDCNQVEVAEVRSLCLPQGLIDPHYSHFVQLYFVFLDFWVPLHNLGMLMFLGGIIKVQNLEGCLFFCLYRIAHHMSIMK